MCRIKLMMVSDQLKQFPTHFLAEAAVSPGRRLHVLYIPGSPGLDIAGTAWCRHLPFLYNDLVRTAIPTVVPDMVLQFRLPARGRISITPPPPLPATGCYAAHAAAGSAEPCPHHPAGSVPAPPTPAVTALRGSKTAAHDITFCGRR